MNEVDTAVGWQSPAPAKAGVDHFMRLRNILLLSAFGFTAFMIGAHGLVVDVAQARETTRSLAYRDGPPFGFSGGFGEDHCQACHSGETLNAGPGGLTISVPARYAPGQVHTITVTLKRPGMKVGGFVLTARFERDSAQAGSLTHSEGQQDRVRISNDRGVQYAYHSRAGTELTGAGVVRWTLRWTAPEGNGAVIFNVAANAANGDDTNAGDFIYLSRGRSRAR